MDSVNKLLTTAEDEYHDFKNRLYFFVKKYPLHIHRKYF